MKLKCLSERFYSAAGRQKCLGVEVAGLVPVGRSGLFALGRSWWLLLMLVEASSLW